MKIHDFRHIISKDCFDNCLLMTTIDHISLVTNGKLDRIVVPDDVPDSLRKKIAPNINKPWQFAFIVGRGANAKKVKGFALFGLSDGKVFEPLFLNLCPIVTINSESDDVVLVVEDREAVEDCFHLLEYLYKQITRLFPYDVYIYSQTQTDMTLADINQLLFLWLTQPTTSIS